MQPRRRPRRKREDAKREDTGMERRARTKSNAASGGLLSRQLASIVDTLAKSSGEREVEAQGRMARARVAKAGLLSTSGSGLERGGDERSGVERDGKGAQSVVTHTAAMTGINKSQASMRSDPDSDGKKDRGDYADPKKMLAELDRASQTFKNNKEEAGDDDPKRMLAEIEGAAPQANQSTTSHDDGIADLKAMLADLDANQRPSTTISATHADEELSLEEMFEKLNALAIDKLNSDKDMGDDVGNPKQALAEIEKISSLATQDVTADDPKAMLADLDANAKARSQRLSQDDNMGIKTLGRERITRLPSFGQWASEGFPGYDKHTPAVTVEGYEALEKECIPYAVALRLESSGCQWEDVQGWSTYLFSNGIDGYEAQVQKEEMIKQENEKLDAIVEYVLEEEKRYRDVEDKERLSCRLMVSNLAADTDEEAVRVFFKEFRWDIRDVVFLDGRDPVKRTRTAYVDMYTRKPAVRASYMVGGIYGLVVNIKLAQE